MACYAPLDALHSFARIAKGGVILHFEAERIREFRLEGDTEQKPGVVKAAPCASGGSRTSHSTDRTSTTAGHT